MTGLEHLPPSDCAAVYVANHQSFLVRKVAPGRWGKEESMWGAAHPGGTQHGETALVAHAVLPDLGIPSSPFKSSPPSKPSPQDITTLFHIRRDFKFISKTSNFLIPIIGWTMYLTGAQWDGAVHASLALEMGQTMRGGRGWGTAGAGVSLHHVLSP